LGEDNVKDDVNEPDNYDSVNKICQIYKVDEIIYKIILNGKQSDGKYSLIEIEFPSEKEKEIPLHKQSKEDVIIYVIEGKFSIQKGNENINAISGMVLKLEKNVLHSYKKVGDGKGKLLILFEPSGFENYFRDLNSLSLLSSSLDSPISDDLHIFDKDDDRIRLHLLEKTYGWTFSS
jgi:quercetin dioxygenase-like cupin family protein